MRKYHHFLLAFGVAVSLALASVTTPAKAQSIDEFFSSLGRAFGGGPEGRHMTKIMANYPAGTLIVSFGDRRLYYLLGKGRAISYPIAIPKDDARWSGVSYVSNKQVNPSWTPTADMRRENPTLPAYVPGGHPRNPLGVRALYIGESLYRIHGTDAPWLIGEKVSHGCVRMYNEDVIDLYNRTSIGAKVVITWQKFTTV